MVRKRKIVIDVAPHAVHYWVRKHLPTCVDDACLGCHGHPAAHQRIKGVPRAFSTLKGVH